MTFIQKLMMRLLPQAWAADMKAESESWLLRCPDCGYVRSIWEIGGIRYKAVSRNKKALVRCTQCGRTRMTLLERKENL